MTKRRMSPRKESTRGCSPGGSWSPTGIVTRPRRRWSAMTTRPPSEGRTSTSCWPPQVRSRTGRHQRLVSSANLNRLTLLICLLRCALTAAESFPSAHIPLSLLRLFFFFRFLCLSALIGEENVCLLSVIAVRGRCCRVAAAHVLISPRWLVSVVRVCAASSLFSQPFIFPPKVMHPVKRFFCVLAKPTALWSAAMRTLLCPFYHDFCPDAYLSAVGG